MRATLLFVSFFISVAAFAEVSRYEPASLDKKGVGAAFRVQMKDWMNHKLPLMNHSQAAIKWHIDHNKLPRPENEVAGEEQHMAWILQNRRYGDESKEASRKVIVPRNGKGECDYYKWQYSQLSAIVDEKDNLVGIRLRSINHNGSGTIKVRDFSTDTIISNEQNGDLTVLVQENLALTGPDKTLRIMRLDLPEGFNGDKENKRLLKTVEQKIRLVYLHHGSYFDADDVFGNVDFSIAFIPNDQKKPEGEGHWVLLKSPGTQLHLNKGGERTVNLAAGKHPLDTRLVEAVITDLKYEKSYGLFGGWDDWEEKGIDNLLPVSVLTEEVLKAFETGK